MKNLQQQTSGVETITKKRKAMSGAERMRLQRQRNKDEPERKQRKLDSLFMFGQVEVSVLTDGDGKIWFKGVDLARALDMEEPNVSISLYIDQKYTESYSELTFTNDKYRHIPGMHPKTTFVNEAGMNLFIIRSRMPKAESFAEWVCGVVLPSIRKTGKFELEKPEDNPYKELSNYLKDQLKEKDFQLKGITSQLSLVTSKLFEMQPTCVPVLKNELKKEYVMIVRTETVENVKFPYYVLRRQEASIDEAYEELKLKYPKMILKLATPNSVNLFNLILEQLDHQIVRWRTNMFYLCDGTDEQTFILNVKNLYRSTYGTSCIK